MPLKAQEPHSIEVPKVKMMISGEAGCGKTTFALSFPKPYLIDSESGAVRTQYQEKLKQSGGVYFGKEQGSDNFEDVINEVRALATEKHEYKTLIIDSFSHLYLLEAAQAELKHGSDFGKDKREANKPTRQLMRWLDKCDMNVILITHSKAKWARKGNEIYQDGNTFEGYPKMEYDLDLWVEIMKGSKTFFIKKSRITSLNQGDSMPLSYDKFAEVYGKDAIESDAKPALLALPEQVKRAKELVEVLNVGSDQIAKLFKKVDVETWEEMTEQQINDVILKLANKLKTFKGKI